ncbi:TetR/AcrR family transcriptional regulator [Nocardioides insulae]|uniref:TetR/AcrR family transcriptional regulator n=1 Tax=Nocardioides insulae TaxID=394734 RepID=UPI000421462C|nr:TetR/AcrR family transcriptional regulator [Nocardioides insulae]
MTALNGPTPRAQERYLEAGLRVLAEEGYAGFKLARVCAELGTTTGSFYHAFPNWATYGSALIRYWRDTRSDQLIRHAREITDLPARVEALTEIALTLPHASEAAIRVWAAHDPEVAAIQTEVDAQRRDFIADTYVSIGGDAVVAREYATTAMLLFIGYESGTMATLEDLRRGFEILTEQTTFQGR